MWVSSQFQDDHGTLYEESLHDGRVMNKNVVNTQVVPVHPVADVSRLTVQLTSSDATTVVEPLVTI